MRTHVNAEPSMEHTVSARSGKTAFVAAVAMSGLNKTGLPWAPVSSPCHMQKKHQSGIPKPSESSLNLPDLSDRHQRGLFCTPHTKAFSRLSLPIYLPARSHGSCSRNVSLPVTFLLSSSEMQGLLGLASGDGRLLLTHPVPQFPHLQNMDNTALPSMSYYNFLDLSTQGPFPHCPTEHRERARRGQENRHIRGSVTSKCHCSEGRARCSPGIQGPPMHWEKTAKAAVCLDVGPRPCQVCHSCPHEADGPACEADNRGLIMR